MRKELVEFITNGRNETLQGMFADAAGLFAGGFDLDACAADFEAVVDGFEGDCFTTDFLAFVDGVDLYAILQAHDVSGKE